MHYFLVFKGLPSGNEDRQWRGLNIKAGLRNGDVLAVIHGGGYTHFTVSRSLLFLEVSYSLLETKGIKI